MLEHLGCPSLRDSAVIGAVVAEYESWWETHMHATTEDWIMWCVGRFRAGMWLRTLSEVRAMDETIGLPYGEDRSRP